MKTNILYLETFGKAFIFDRLRPKLRKYFLKAGYQEVPYTFFGVIFWLSAIVTGTIYLGGVYLNIRDMGGLLFFLLTFFLWIFIQLFTGAVLGLLFYFYTDIKIYKRTKNLEENLPDYLNLVSVNLKGGMSFENALWTAIKPEFEVLAKEITIVSKSVMTGNDVKSALAEFSEKYNSPILKRSIDLIIGEVEGGGKIVEVIDSLVSNLKKSSKLKNELRVATTTYMIFISVIVIAVAPALFAISFQLLEMITGFASNLSGAQATGAPISFGGSTVSTEDFKSFSYFALAIISLFSSMIVSTIEKGDVKGGLKYIPLFVFGSLIMYFVLSGVMSFLFSGIRIG